MKIIQITDLHISPKNEFPRGIDVRQNFLNILAAAKDKNPDLLVITGDVCYDTPSEETCIWVKRQLDSTGLPYKVIAGNHDNPIMIASVFGNEAHLHGGEPFWKESFERIEFYFLETSSGYFSKQQLEWLKSQLKSGQEIAVIFMHHPPFLCGVQYMDIHWSLKDSEPLQEVLFSSERNILVFCGHYHVERTIIRQNVTVHITPSTYSQMKWDTAEFEVDHDRVGFREIIIRKDGAVESTVVYLDGTKKEIP